MARKLSDIYTALIAEKVAQATLNGLEPAIDSHQTLLTDLTTQSKVASWRLMLAVVAVGIWVHEQLWDVAKAELIDLADKAQAGTLRWYREQCLLFQFGDSLQWLDGKYKYFIITPANQIVQRAACVEAGGNLIIKVAKLVAGVVTPLDFTELAAFTTYINQIKYAGTVTQVVSAAADLLKLQYKVYYNPLVMAADGTLLSDGVSKPAEEAINNFITNLPFNGRLNLSAIDDAVQAATGVLDVSRTLAEAKYGIIPYAAITDYYYPNAGYLNIDPAYPLAANITYIPTL
jgi:hypothetical protein